MLMGKKAETRKKECTPDFENILVSFSPFRMRTIHPAHSRKSWGWSDPVRAFGRQNRINTGVAPVQIEVFVRGLFSDHPSFNQVSDGALLQRATEHQEHILGRTLRVLQRSGSDRDAVRRG
jgi:hypothetical protein